MSRTITFIRKTETMMQYVEPCEGFTLEGIVAALNTGNATARYSESEGVYEIVYCKKGGGTMDEVVMGTFKEYEPTAAAVEDELFVLLPE
jgi:hypothetical protein